MPFCPECKEEYEGNVERCADCDVDLVPSLETSGNGVPAEVKIMVANKQVGERLVDFLLMEGVEAALDGETHRWNDREVPAVKIPGQYYEFVAVFLTRSNQFQVVETDAEGKGLVDFFDPTRSASARSHPLMRKKPREIVALGEAVVPDLTEILKEGDAEVRRWSLRRLLDLGAPGLKAMVDVAYEGVLVGDRDLVFPVLRAVEEGIETGLEVARGIPERVREAFRSGDASIRALACLVTGKFGRPGDAAAMVVLLRDPEPLVLEEVVEAFDALTGIDLDLHAESGEADRERAIQTLKAWLEDHTNSP